MSAIDWSKPIEFENGESCHVLSIHSEGSANFPECTHVIQRDGVEGMTAIWWYKEDGKSDWPGYNIRNKS